jgi:hypothetical protein
MARSGQVGAPTNMLGAEPVFTIQAELSASMNLGRVPYGEQRIIDITGATRYGAQSLTGAFCRVAPIGKSCAGRAVRLDVYEVK